MAYHSYEQRMAVVQCLRSAIGDLPNADIPDTRAVAEQLAEYFLRELESAGWSLTKQTADG